MRPIETGLPGPDPWLKWLAFAWGACTYFPIGIAYLCCLTMLAGLLIRPGLPHRVQRLRQTGLLFPVLAVLFWCLVVAAMGPWFADTPTRLFHAVRVALVLAMGLMLLPQEAWFAIRGFLAASIAAAGIVAVHQLVGLPDWTIWSSLLRSRNNFSSANMIMMATASGLWFLVGIRQEADRGLRWVAWCAALALGLTVLVHSVSRNAQLLVALLAMLALVVGWRRRQAFVWALCAALAIGGLAWLGSPATQQRFGAAVQELDQAREGVDFTTSTGVRYKMAQVAVQGMLEQPFTGTGVGSWQLRWRPVAADAGAALPPERLAHYLEINNPHNDYLLAAMETGVPGLLTLGWMMLAFLWFGWRRRSFAGNVAFLLAATLSLVTLVNAPLRDAALGMTLLWLLAGACAAAQGEARP